MSGELAQPRGRRITKKNCYGSSDHLACNATSASAKSEHATFFGKLPGEDKKERKGRERKEGRRQEGRQGGREQKNQARKQARKREGTGDAR